MHSIAFRINCIPSLPISHMKSLLEVVYKGELCVGVGVSHVMCVWVCVCHVMCVWVCVCHM